jgi:hypothetical protein
VLRRRDAPEGGREAKRSSCDPSVVSPAGAGPHHGLNKSARGDLSAEALPVQGRGKQPVDGERVYVVEVILQFRLIGFPCPDGFAFELGALHAEPYVSLRFRGF